MERPGSRGSLALSVAGVSKAPTGTAIPVPDRPSTANRMSVGPPGTANARPPGTALRSAAGPPPSTAYQRAGVPARPGTASRQAVNLQVENRPITNHGVGGLKTASPQNRRQVLDKGYFLNELRKKRQDIMGVLNQMREDLQSFDQKQSQFAKCEKRHADLTQEVKSLKESLAEYNMVLDKVGSQSPISSITSEHADLKKRNDNQRKRVDDILTERFSVEQKTKQVESKCSDIQQNLEARLNSLAPSARQQYSQLLNEQAQLAAESARFEEELADMDRTLASSEGELARNTLKQRALELQEQIKSLTERKYEMSMDEEASRRRPEEQKEALMGRVKRDNAEIERTTAALKELQEAVRRLEGRIGAVQGGASSAANQAGEASKREKFDELVAKERELNTFVDSFPSRKAAKAAEMSAAADSVLALLDRISKLGALATSALPSQQQFKEMQDELEYKRLQFESAASTQERLKEELGLRRGELDKIDSLEDKIGKELAALEQKTEALNKDLAQYSNVAHVKQSLEERLQLLEEQKASMLRRKDLFKAMVAEKAWKQQAKKTQLQENTVQVNLDKIEQKYRALQANIYQMLEFIKQKESETNYQPLVLNIQDAAGELNMFIARTCQV